MGLAGSVAMPHLDGLGRLGAAAERNPLARNPLANLFFDDRDLGPRSAAYLAIRAARRALHDNPDNPFAHLLLGEAYFRLGTKTQEKSWAKNYGRSFGRIRAIQTIAAYKQALQLKPDLELAHQRLAGIFQNMNCKDVALKHYQEYLKLVGAREPGRGESKELARKKNMVALREKEIKRLQDEYEINSQNLKVVDRAVLADDKGLVELALDILLKEDVAAFGATGMDLELKLLLLTGQIEKVREWMDEEKEKVLPDYRWNKVQLNAALGDYDQADKDLEARIIMPKIGDKKIPLRSAGALILGQGLLDVNDSIFFKNPNRILAGRDAMPQGYDGLFPGREGTLSALMMAGNGLDQEANIFDLRGLLALESGRIAKADAFFHRAQDFWNSATGTFFHSPEARFGRQIAKQSLQMLRK